jgi:hypothetical protein
MVPARGTAWSTETASLSSMAQTHFYEKMSDAGLIEEVLIQRSRDRRRLEG